MIRNQQDYYYYSVENTEAPPSSPVIEVNNNEEEVEKDRNYHCAHNPKRPKRFRRSPSPKKAFIFKNKAEVKNFLSQNDNFLLFSCSVCSCLPTEETTTIHPNVIQIINNTQQNQKSTKKEGNFKTDLKKLYTEEKTILGTVKNGLNRFLGSLKYGFNEIYNSKIFQRGKDVAGKGIKRVLGSEVVNSLKKEAIEQTKDLTKNFGKQMINKGAAIITASANAAGK